MSGLALKLLAMLIMLIDHTGVVLFRAGLIARPLYRVLRIIGRGAFPIFCFLLAVLCTVCFAAPFSVCAATSLDFRSSGDASGAGYSWNAAKRTLTLNGFTLQTDAVSAIRLPKNSTIFYTGECTISSSGASAVSAEGMLSIIEKSASALIELSGAPYAAEAAETILYGNSITLRGSRTRRSRSSRSRRRTAIRFWSCAAVRIKTRPTREKRARAPAHSIPFTRRRKRAAA